MYPAQHKANHSNFSAQSLKILGGSAPKPIDRALLQAAARLYTTLHLTAGKVGAPGMWRQNVEETIAFAWEAFVGLRTTFPENGEFSSTPTRFWPIERTFQMLVEINITSCNPMMTH
jgi:hypothetical protein